MTGCLVYFVAFIIIFMEQIFKKEGMHSLFVNSCKDSIDSMDIQFQKCWVISG